MGDCSCPTFTLLGTSTTVYFPMPEWASPDNGITKTIDLFDFWSDDIETVDKGINGQPLTLGGTYCICGLREGVDYSVCFPLCFPICFTEASGEDRIMELTAWLESIETAMNAGEEFTISELGSCLNGVYVIKSFTFNTIPKSNECFSWNLQLERIRDIN